MTMKVKRKKPRLNPRMHFEAIMYYGHGAQEQLRRLEQFLRHFGSQLDRAGLALIRSAIRLTRTYLKSGCDPMAGIPC